MRILHTSDWHVGKLLEGRHMTDDQAYTLGDFVRLAAELRPDVVIIAGDLYDRAVPPPDAVVLLDETLRKLVLELGLPTVVLQEGGYATDELGENVRRWLTGIA